MILAIINIDFNVKITKLRNKQNKMAQQSNLERIGIDEREQEFIKSPYTYNEENPYNEAHPDARADGDKKGKGTGTPMSVLNIPTQKVRHDTPQAWGETLDTDIDNGAGNSYDHDGAKGVQGAFQGDAGRTYLTQTSKLNPYGPGHEYGKDSVDTTNNVVGQYWVE